MVTIDDARELRGATARLLASYPDHPGLLFGRALAEMIDPDGDLGDAIRSLDQALHAMPRYDISVEQRDVLASWVIQRAAMLRPHVLAEAAAFFDRRQIVGETIDQAVRDAPPDWCEDPAFASVLLARGLERECDELNHMVTRIRRR